MNNPNIWLANEPTSYDQPPLPLHYGTILKKLGRHEYNTAADCLKDILQVSQNTRESVLESMGSHTSLVLQVGELITTLSAFE
jgi:hypothetical protein